MSIKITFTGSFGQLIGSTTENLDGSISIEDPCVVQISQTQLALIPLLGTVKQKTLTLDKSEVKGVFDPQDDIRNHYTQQFGGIQLIVDSDSPELSL